MRYLIPIVLLVLTAGLTSLAVRSAHPVGDQAPPPHADSTGARLLLTREAGTVRVTGLYDAPVGASDSLRYALSVLREGEAGRSSSRQGGVFAPAPGHTDTLAVSSVNVAPGDRLQVHLRLYAADQVVDEALFDEVVSAAQ